jgi:hypothetical protein
MARRLLESWPRRSVASVKNTRSTDEARLHTQRLAGLHLLAVRRPWDAQADQPAEARYHDA